MRNILRAHSSLIRHLQNSASSSLYLIGKRFNIYTAFSSEVRLKEIFKKIHSENKTVTQLDIIKKLFEYFPKVSTVEQVSRKFAILNDICNLHKIYTAEEIQITKNSPKSIVLTNKRYSSSSTAFERIAIHFHSIGFVSGEPEHIVNPLSHFYQNTFFSKVLIVGLPHFPQSSMQAILQEAYDAYKYAIIELKASPNCLVLSGSSSGCILPVKLMLLLNRKRETIYEPLTELPYRKGPFLIHRPKKIYAAAILALSPIYDHLQHCNFSKDPFLTQDVVSVIKQIYRDNKPDADMTLQNLKPEETKFLSYFLNISDDTDPGFDSVLHLRNQFILEKNRHWFSYKNYSGQFHLSHFVPILSENHGIRTFCEFFLKSNTNI